MIKIALRYVRHRSGAAFDLSWSFRWSRCPG